jgi:[ribosomal protein S18]-alanine N-acetyltransferase
MASAQVEFELRAMTLDDLDDVMINEASSYSHPWSRGIFDDCIKSGYECFVFIVDEKVVGHSILSVAVGESHLLNVCINPAVQSRGFGRQLVQHIVSRAISRGAATVFLEVRPSNLIAFKLYESLGFQEIGLRKDYYPAENGREDALVFSYQVPDTFP